MADSEPECTEQREARELAARLRAEMLVLRDMQARGVGPPANEKAASADDPLQLVPL